MDHIFNIMLFPFRAGSSFVVIPCMFAFVCALFSLVYRLIRGKYNA